MRSERWPEARAALDKSIALVANNSRAALLLAEVMLKQNEIDEAVEQFRHAADLDPHNPTGLVRAVLLVGFLQFAQLVAQGGNAGGGEVGLLVLLGEEVARVRLKRHHATGHAAVTCLIFQQGQHGLVATVHAVKVANRQRTG